MIRIGLTGGIGSGKTTVLEVFKLLGIKTYVSDMESKRIIQSDRKLIAEIKKRFGNELYDQNQILDRKKLAGIVFKDKSALNELNKLVHPAVINDFNKWLKRMKNEAYVIKESALFFEAEITGVVDRIVTVYAPDKKKVDRIRKRDGVSEENVLERMKNQLPDSEKMKRADYVILNDGSQSVIEQILSLHNELKNMAKPG